MNNLLPAHMNPTEADTNIILQIAKRACKDLKSDLVCTLMDLNATHLNGCPLDLQKLLEFDDFNFAHDIRGIARHLQRSSGVLMNCFSPRSSSHNKIYVKLGYIFYENINQAERECEIVKITKTRFRIEYELPNSGMTGSWRYHENLIYTKQ